MFFKIHLHYVVKFMFRNFYVKKTTLHCLISKSGYLHCNLTGYLLSLSVYLQNTCTEFVGKSALKPLGDKFIYCVTNLIIFLLETLASLVENKYATWNSKSSDKLPPPLPPKNISSYIMVKEIADLVFMVAGKPALAWNLTTIVLHSKCQSQC